MISRIVIDTNIFISSVFRDGNPRQVIQQSKVRDIALLTSPEIAREVERVLHYPKFAKDFAKIKRTPAEVYADYAEIMDWIQADSIEAIPALTDSSDSIFLACAVTGQAQYVVSGDNHLLNLKLYQAIPIVTPAEFLAILNTPASPTADTPTDS